MLQNTHRANIAVIMSSKTWYTPAAGPPVGTRVMTTYCLIVPAASQMNDISAIARVLIFEKLVIAWGEQINKSAPIPNQV